MNAETAQIFNKSLFFATTLKPDCFVVFRLLQHVSLVQFNVKKAKKFGIKYQISLLSIPKLRYRCKCYLFRSISFHSTNSHKRSRAVSFSELVIKGMRW
jgi:hypothetical protein